MIRYGQGKSFTYDLDCPRPSLKDIVTLASKTTDWKSSLSPGQGERKNERIYLWMYATSFRTINFEKKSKRLRKWEISKLQANQQSQETWCGKLQEATKIDLADSIYLLFRSVFHRFFNVYSCRHLAGLGYLQKYVLSSLGPAEKVSSGLNKVIENNDL